MVPYEALYERPCRSRLCWVEPDEHVVMGPQIIEKTTKKILAIWDQLNTVQSRLKSYADLDQREVEYDLGDFVFLKVSPIHEVTRLIGIKGKLAPRYMGPFEIVEKVGEVAYRLNLPPQLGHVHNVFQVSVLKNYRHEPSHILPYTEIPL